MKYVRMGFSSGGGEPIFCTMHILADVNSARRYMRLRAPLLSELRDDDGFQLDSHNEWIKTDRRDGGLQPTGFRYKPLLWIIQISRHLRVVVERVHNSK